jgi:diguanylate cyclase (GGDEF)-like protein
MSDEFDPKDELLQQLRKEYLAEAPARLDELRKDLAAARAGEPEAAASLRSRFHKLAGSGGSYGFQAITEASRMGEHWLLENPEPDDNGFAWLGGVVGRIAAAFDDAAREISIAPVPVAARPDAFGWRAHIVGPTSELVTRLADSLREAQFQVTTAPGDPPPDPTGFPATERPDLIVLVPGEQDDPSWLIRWREGLSDRAVSIALVTDRPPRDLLEGRLSGVDLVASGDRAEAEIARWARAIARAGSTPLAALVVLPEDAERWSVTRRLEAEGIQVTSAEDGEAGLGRIREETPDLVLLDWVLPGKTAPVLVRLLRADPQTALMPVLALTGPDPETSIAEMLAAGVDAPIERPISLDRLVAEVIHRARRSRRLEALLRRDGLTGFLTRGALEDELDVVLAQARRSGEQIAFVVLDPDHFRRVNEQLGRRVGDQILLHIAQAIRCRVRASDYLIRMGGEEFGILLRQCGATEALAIANQIRNAVLERPPQVEETPLPIRLSAGIASSTHIISARDLLWEAEQALLEAKQTGRDKVVVSERR